MVQNIKTSFQIIKHFLFHDRIFKDVQKNITDQSTEFEKLLEEDFDITKSLRFLDKMELETKGFGEAAINDLLIMICMKCITLLFEKYAIDEAFLPGVIKTDEGVDSLKPLTDIDNLVTQMKLDPSYFENFKYIIEAGIRFNEKDPYKEIFSKLTDYSDLNAKLMSYLEEHGDRSFEELKLECLTLKQSPKNFLELLNFKYHAKSKPIEPRSSLAQLDTSASAF